MSKRETMETRVGIGAGDFGCDHEGCNNFRTKDLNEHNKHIEKHRVLSGANSCKECGELVEYPKLEPHQRPTLKEHNENFVFHPDCSTPYCSFR